MRRVLVIGLALTGALAAFVYVNNSGVLVATRAGKPTLLAHRGLHQTFPADGLKADTCTAERIHPPEHGYLENTIASMQAAFDAGADVVELDIHPTTDGHFAVLHDWTLDCRTDGKGVTREHTLAELKALDIGYDYTADGGKTHPFRGKGVGQMPSLDEVLAAFPRRRVLIDIKSNDPADGEKLARRLSRLPPTQLSRIMVDGGDRPVAAVRERLPHLKTMSRAGLRSCLLSYVGMGWTGYVPAACRGSLLLIPINVAPWLWGWPDRFLERLAGAGAEIFVAGPWDGGFSQGIDDAAVFRRLPAGYSGGIWTNRIDRVAPLAAAQRDAQRLRQGP
jgi:glycerophosphoryl diester phosphodiesterase